MEAICDEVPRKVCQWFVARDSRKCWVFALHMMPFLITVIAYKSFRSLIFMRGNIHVGDLYALEEYLFAIDTAEGPHAVSEVVARATHPVLDVLCGAAYLLYLPEVVGLAVYWFVQDRARSLFTSLGFLIGNLLGWAIWLAYPAAPPWYVDLHGTGPAMLDVASNAAGLIRLDDLLGLPVAATLYAKSENVFGAMPSLHVTYAIFIMLVTWPVRGSLRVATAVFAAVVAFSAVYLRHHYVLDVLAGALLGVVTWWLTRLLVRKFGYAVRP